MKLDSNKGLTLIEVMIAISIISIFASISLPTFNKYLDYLRLKTATNNLINDLQWSRQQAITKQEEYGLLFYEDKDKYQVVKGGEEYQIIREVNLKEEGINLKEITFFDEGFAKVVLFQSLGNLANHNGGVTLAKDGCKNRRIIFSSNAGELNLR